MENQHEVVCVDGVIRSRYMRWVWRARNASIATYKISNRRMMSQKKESFSRDVNTRRRCDSNFSQQSKRYVNRPCSSFCMA